MFNFTKNLIKITEQVQKMSFKIGLLNVNIYRCLDSFTQIGTVRETIMFKKFSIVSEH